MFIVNKTELIPQNTPDEIDAELAGVLYGSRFDELANFFFRRTQNPEIVAALLAETFATAAQIRMKRSDRSAQDHEWLTSIATLELSRYFRAGKPAAKAVASLGLVIPEITEDMVERFTQPQQLNAQHGASSLAEALVLS